MKRIQTVLLAATIAIIIVLASFELAPYLNLGPNNQKEIPSGFYFGVSFCGNTTTQAKLLIDKVKSYTNLFVVQSGPVSYNETILNEIVDYAVKSGLYVIVYFGYFSPVVSWRVPWLDYAKQEWGNHFLGVYLNDEPGGQAIDSNYTEYYDQLRIHDASAFYSHEPSITLALNGTLPFNSYQASQAEYHFVSDWQAALGLSNLQSRSINAFTSDYALYWFDYLIGYNTIFAELGSNQSTTQAIDMARGAAELQNKTWGTIITWTYDQAPYLTNSSEMYNELVTSYEAGAKYEIIFDYPQIGDNPYGVLTNSHFEAMQEFWNTIPKLKTITPSAALVLPQNYGWGMRSQQDSIWGIWKPDNSTSTQIWNTTQNLLAEFGLNLDIVYQDQSFPVLGKYSQIYYWNGTA